MIERNSPQENLDAALKFGEWITQAEHDPKRLTDEEILTELTHGDVQELLEA